MSEQQEPEPPQEQPEAAETARPRVRRLVLRAGAILLALMMGLIATGLTVDLGPKLKARAEKEASKYLQRPMHIGRLKSKLIPGVFVFEDLTIEGLTPADRPFLTAKQITVWIPWWSI